MAFLLFFGAIVLGESNQSLFLALNHAGNMLDKDWWARLTILGDGAVALALVLPCIRKSPQRFWAALLAALGLALLIWACKHLVPIPRPLAVFPSNEFFYSGPRLRKASFPSGHASVIFALCGIWIMSLSGRYLLRTLLLLLATLVAVSRIMVGVHWPLDVLAGMLTGWAAAYAGLRLSIRLQWRTSGTGGLVAGSMLLAIAAGLLFSTHTGFNSAFDLQRLAGLICLISGVQEIMLLRFPFLYAQVMSKAEPKAGRADERKQIM